MPPKANKKEDNPKSKPPIPASPSKALVPVKQKKKRS